MDNINSKVISIIAFLVVVFIGFFFLKGMICVLRDDTVIHLDNNKQIFQVDTTTFKTYSCIRTIIVR